jgi:hypothetical protein
MGYYANSFEGNITIPSANLGDALNAIAEQYTAYNNDPLWGTHGKLEIPTDLEAELEIAGFEFMSDTDDLVIYSYNSKWRMYTEALLRALMSVATPDSAMAFRGEDGEMWRFTKDGVQNATIVWS